MSFLDGIIKKIKPKRKSALKKSEHLYRDWFFSLITFFVLVFFGAVFGVYMFIDAENIEITPDNTGENTYRDIINQELLVETIDFYSAKEERFSDFQNNFKGAPRI